MSATIMERRKAARELQLTTFYVGELLLGIDIDRVQEINRLLDVTAVPRSPDFVRGVINLRGEVVTVVDLRALLGLPKTESTRLTRNMIIKNGDELIGMWVDRISDIVSMREDDLALPPSNVNGIDGRFFKGVYTMEKEILVVLNLSELLSDRI